MGSSRTLRLWASACHHGGAPTFNRTQFESHVTLALKNKWRALLLGDLINNGVSAGSKHIGLEWQDIMNPLDQCEQMVDLLAPLAREGLIAGIWGGNHSYRSVKAVGIHPEKFIAMMLSIVATKGAKPAAVLPTILQRVHELQDASQEAAAGGQAPVRAMLAKERLIEEIRKVQPGTEDKWAIPFFPGLGFIELDGVAIACHHGTHSKTKDNWAQLENAAQGFRLYFTAHNHSMGWQTDDVIIRGKTYRADYYSVGTYQGYEEYARVACYGKKPTGSLFVEYDVATDQERHERLY